MALTTVSTLYRFLWRDFDYPLEQSPEASLPRALLHCPRSLHLQASQAVIGVVAPSPWLLLILHVESQVWLPSLLLLFPQLAFFVFLLVS